MTGDKGSEREATAPLGRAILTSHCETIAGLIRSLKDGFADA